ncbi:TIGR03943 family putative permease subunit [Anaerotignum sp.]|uniref:TIGR03943 family putative permease subunit n=1 Tax=Anaerotignum sp. TaxID=2039241 RepID=UPI0028AAF0D1|nr:hypothetical protein [Anaerotignum sp.]
MKRAVIFLVAVLLSCMFISGCGARKGGENSSQGADSNTQSQKIEAQEQSLPTVSPDTIAPPTVSSVQPASPEPEETNSADILIIGEKMFLTQINEIYYNFDQYKDKTIVVEGMYTLLFNQDGVREIPAVYRRGPGCCGNDGWGGFLLKYDGDYPEDDAWIKVTGTPELVDNGYFQDLYLNVSSIEVLDERGEEFVTQ